MIVDRNYTDLKFKTCDDMQFAAKLAKNKVSFKVGIFQANNVYSIRDNLC